MSKEDQNLTSDEIPEKTIEYAWKWFEYHAGQRLIAFRFFLILLGAVLVSVRDSIEKEQFFFIGVIGGISFVISLAFLAIEVRNKQLVDLGREALKKIENSSFKQDYNLLKLAHNSLEERHWLLSYSFWLNSIFILCAILSFCLVGYAVVRNF
ncbi:MAG: hypothetical protein GVY17_00360 [Cyanobacteria bacterium]|jgi:uncharacterized membrane protein YccF (DUF307 family)|nr:hypothetical protein [Cyanobacteria bacterium GSL.Bin21]